MIVKPTRDGAIDARDRGSRDTRAFAICRFRTAYDAAEDRVRFETVDYGTGRQVIYATRRLLDDLIPVLAENLEKTGRSHSQVQQFEQDRVRRKQGHRATDTPDASLRDAPTWLCKAVRVSARDSGLVLTFLGDKEPVTQMLLTWTDIRSFLDILLLAYRRGYWATAVFPDWIRLRSQTRRHLQTHRLQ